MRARLLLVAGTVAGAAGALVAAASKRRQAKPDVWREATKAQQH